MSNKLEHVPNALKHAGDAAAWIGSVMTWIMTTMTPVLQFSILILSVIWCYYRVQDMLLSNQLKKLKIRRHKDT